VRCAGASAWPALPPCGGSFRNYTESIPWKQRKGSVITLTGHVRTWAEHDAVVGAAWMARGVIDVDDNLQITG